jgi:hypothetical protein
MSVFHSNTERLIDYWRSLGGQRRPPARASIDPGVFSELLPQVFMLARVASGLYPVRLSGGFVADLHQSDLRGRNALTLFRERDRIELRAALETARRRPEPIVATVDIATNGSTLGMEVLFAPLAGAEHTPDRFLGLYQPLDRISRLGDAPVRELALRELRGGGAANEEIPRLRLATLDGRRIA